MMLDGERWRAHQAARERLLRRVAESQAEIATRPTREEEAAREDARTAAVLESYLDLPAVRAERERQALITLGTWKRCEREAPEKMRAWLREGRT